MFPTDTPLIESKWQRVNVTPGLKQWFATFAQFVTAHQLRVVCRYCHSHIANVARAFAHGSDCLGQQPDPNYPTATMAITDLGLTRDGILLPRDEMTASQIEWIRQFSDVGPHFNLMLLCDKCRVPVEGLNADTDATFMVGCACRQLVGANRDYHPEPALVEH